jgi:leucyl aminopeptidase
MKITFKRDENTSIKIVFAATKDEKLNLSNAATEFDAISDGKLSAILAAANYVGAQNTTQVIHAFSNDISTLVVCGLGDIDKINAESFEKASASAVKAIANHGSDIGFYVDEFGADFASSALMGAKLALYRFDKYRTKLKPSQELKIQSINIDSPDAEAAFSAKSAIADGVYFARDLMNEPPNILTTTEFANRLQDLAKFGVKVSVVDAEQMRELKMFSYLGVGQGSVNPPKLVVLEYNGGEGAPTALVGKGLCFDSGGISLKPSGGMEDMKGDMGGAAAVSGAMLAIGARKAKANVIGFIGLAENMPDAGAQRPGDIVTSMSGQTIEVLNTDAEGRLVLCDVLTFAQEKFAPKIVIDVATLTGAIVIALGSEFAGLFSNSDKLSQDLTTSGNLIGEKVWRFPLSPAYDKQLDSNIADMKNVQRSGPGAGAGSITAAQFLQRFIKDGVEWAHIDIAGTAWQSSSEDARSPSWGTGFGVRLLNEFIAKNCEN